MSVAFSSGAFHNEWLLTNGLGGYGLGFGNHLNERKYNGLLIAGLPGFKRIHVVSGLEETLECQGVKFNLDSNHYPDTIHPQGYRQIVKSWLRPFPTTLYSTDPVREDLLVTKELYFIKGTNGLVIRYANMGTFPVFLTLRPKLSLRGHHDLNPSGLWDRQDTELGLEGNSFSLFHPGLDSSCWGYTQTGDMVEDRVIYRNVFYPLEARRGYAALEDLFSPVKISFRLAPEQFEYVLFSLGEMDSPFDQATRTEAAYLKYPRPLDHPRRIKRRTNRLGLLKWDERVFESKQYRKLLEQAAGDFLTDSDCLAGYPWFGPWGRDSMIALTGISMLSGGKSVALRILKRYGRAARDGLLPNTFGEGEEGLNYSSVDGPLWFVLRCAQLAPKNKELFDCCVEVVLNYAFNPDLPFFMDRDGLICLRPGPWSLTWMDARIYGSPVTPRSGRPVEVNALWYGALRSLVDMAEQRQHGDDLEVTDKSFSLSLSDLEALADRTKAALTGFAGPGGLADVLTDEGPVFDIRPNGVVACALDYDIWDEDIMARVYDTAQKELLTPFGLRSLNPGHPAFKNKYLGGVKQRDLAYHQGTVWVWPLASMARLHLKTHPHDEPQERIKALNSLVWSFRDALLKNFVASTAEIFDGWEPGRPRGCPAQAWSVMALLEIESMIDELEDDR